MIQGESLSSGGSTPGTSSKQSLSTPRPQSPATASPSRRASKTVPTSFPDSSPTDAAESTTIQQHLDRRRKSFHLPHGKKKPSLASLRADSEAAAWHEQMNEVEEEEADEERGARSVTFDIEELRRTMPEAVKMLQAGGEEWEGVDLEKGLERGYAWDVMFENQRGIHFLGKAYFSSNSLLPSEPSHFTLPDHPLPSASTLIVSTASDTPGPDRSTHTAQPSRIIDRLHKPKADPSIAYDVNYGEHKINLSAEHRNIKTAYSLSTFQCPGPQWEWVTPWMINMKVGTDEGGWKYNAWFKNKGWRNHAGPAGWAGWVRRREWVRLRMVRPLGGGEEGDQRVDEQEERKEAGAAYVKRDLKQVSEEFEGDERFEKILHIMSNIPLDREKLAWWDDGLKMAKDEREICTGLQALLDESENVKLLHRAFTHRSTFSAFLELLEANHYTVAALPPSHVVATHPV